MQGSSKFFYIINAIGPEKYYEYSTGLEIEKINLFGKEYILEQCAIKYNNTLLDEAYRIYIAETLRLISKNSAKTANGGEYMNKKYYDIIHPQPQDERPPEAIVEDVIKKTGIRLVKKNESI